jgi:hypothetical protein
VLIILVPLPLFFASTVYGAGGLTAWVVIGIIWTFLSAFSVVLYPLWESRAAILLISRGIIKVRPCFYFHEIPFDLCATRIFSRGGVGNSQSPRQCRPLERKREMNAINECV